MSVPQPGADADAEPGVDWTALAGDTFADFYEAQYRAVVRLAAALVGRWDVAEELVQDAFIALYPRWTRISSYDAPDAWLRRVVLNRALSSLRTRRGRRARPRTARRTAVRRAPPASSSTPSSRGRDRCGLDRRRVRRGCIRGAG